MQSAKLKIMTSSLHPSPPSSPALMRMQWHDLAFLHWPVAPELLQQYLPDGLELDTFGGQAYLGVVPFEMRGVGAKNLPEVPLTNQFLELNLRTYVHPKGRPHDRPGVWFFSLDASSALAVRGARTLFHLPYFDAAMRSSWYMDGWLEYRSTRLGKTRLIKDARKSGSSADFHALYRPSGFPFRSTVGSLEHWLTERYCLYSADRKDQIYRGEILHRPWWLQQGEVKIIENTVGLQVGLELKTAPPLVHFVRSLEVLAWGLERI